MANLQLPINQDHEVLGSEYCAGYLDTLQKWNNGFYCPASDESQDVFCCGTDSHKYCCTKKDQVVQAEVENFTVLVGIIVGASAALLILTLVSCFCCSCCLLYKKQNPNSASLYHLHTTSEHSGVSNMYSLSNLASRSATPLPIGGLGMSQSVVPPGGGILVGGPNHHASQHHLYSSQLLLDDSTNPHNEFHMSILNGRGASLSLPHSQTLPHNLSHHGKGIINRGNPDLISHNGQQIVYNTLGRNPLIMSQHPESLTYQADVKSGGFSAHQESISPQFIRNPETYLVNSISQDISLTYKPNHMIFPHRQQQHQQPSLIDEQEDKQLFHSTKF